MDLKVEEVSIELSLADGHGTVPCYISQEPMTEISSGTPKTPFLSLNNLLQRQFYNLCPPALLRELSFCSKAMNRIKCPPAYVSSYTRLYGPSIQVYIYTEVPDQTAVVEIRNELSLTCVNSGDISRCLGKYVFHHNKVKLDNSQLSSEEFNVVLNPNVTSFQCFIPRLPEDQTFAKILERMPNLQYLKYETFEVIPDLLSVLFQWTQRSRLREMELKGMSDMYVNNFLSYPRLLCNFMRRQEEYFKMILFINNANIEPALLEYFDLYSFVIYNSEKYVKSVNEVKSDIVGAAFFEAIVLAIAWTSGYITDPVSYGTGLVLIYHNQTTANGCFIASRNICTASWAFQYSAMSVVEIMHAKPAAESLIPSIDRDIDNDGHFMNESQENDNKTIKGLVEAGGKYAELVKKQELAQ